MEHSAAVGPREQKSNEGLTRQITPLPICKVKEASISHRSCCSRPPTLLIVFVGLHRLCEDMYLNPCTVNLLSCITESASRSRK
jgi:hypothetical protein